ncbi:hypothetical protein JNO54_04030 [Janibacter sp. YIM B02568]|uniref:hypothetical protein n=1 Tax=Janibacter endophyticus TaxID=2806261 RepID=UPI00194E606C|nr:hypothetical protein [Janibacter endophyticus]MBM6545309.1 hypothetical protein [Janibacter endophyticus]
MTLVAAAVVPAAPALLPGLGGAADPLAELRDRARATLAAAVAADPEAQVVVVCGATNLEGGLARRPVRLEWATDAPSGAARFTTGRVPAGALPTGLEIGRELLGDDVAARFVSVADDAAARECASLGAALVRGRPTVLAVVADGSATRTVKAPGHLDERAEGFDARIARALAEVDGQALLAIDPMLADALWCRGRAALQVLAGALGMPDARDGAPLASPGLIGDVTLDEAPYGVGYLVATWLPTGT